MDKNLKVKHLLDHYDTNKLDTLTLGQFKVMMAELEEAGWRRVNPKKGKEISEMDVKAIFRMVDVDKSGNISRTEARMATKLLLKRFGINDVPKWMRKTDMDQDGRLTFKEFRSDIIHTVKEHNEK